MYLRHCIQCKEQVKTKNSRGGGLICLNCAEINAEKEFNRRKNIYKNRKLIIRELRSNS